VASTYRRKFLCCLTELRDGKGVLCISNTGVFAVFVGQLGLTLGRGNDLCGTQLERSLGILGVKFQGSHRNIACSDSH
jgi:hypothetical protein